MKKGLVTGFVFLCGLLLGMGLMQLLGPENRSTAVPETSTIQRDASESDALLARIREQESEIVRLRSELAAASQAPPELLPEPEPEPELEPERRSGFGRRMDERMGQRVDELVGTYGLNDAQRARLEEVFRKQFEYFRARRSGEEVEPFNLDDEISAILSPEQFAEYLEDSQEEIYNRAELIATTQVLRLAQSVELADDQQEEVYNAINLAAQEWMIARQTGDDFDMRGAVEERLGSVLTEEQLSAYRESMRGGPGFGMGGGPPGMGP